MGVNVKKTTLVHKMGRFVIYLEFQKSCEKGHYISEKGTRQNIGVVNDPVTPRGLCHFGLTLPIRACDHET